MLIPPNLKALHFAARPRVVARYLGQVFVVLAALNVVPAGVALADGWPGIALRYLAIIALLVLVGAAASRLRAETAIQRNEALVISALAFVVPPFLLAVPLMGYGLGYLDALFEAVSGVTTTGLSTLPSVARMPFAFHFARAWMQWVGGLGVIVLCLAFLVEPGIAAKHLGFGPREVDDVGGGTRAQARRGLVSYGVLTVAGIALLALFGMGPGDAVVHALTAISTGGFSGHDESFGAVPAGPRYAVLAICFAGAVPFHLYNTLRRGQGRAVLGDAQLRALVASVVAVTAALFALQWGADRSHPLESLGNAVFTAVSAQTTAGFSVVPYDALGHAANAVVIAAMIVGGGLGSTAGGIKVLRLLILARFMQIVLVRCSVPRSAHVSTHLGGRALEFGEIEASAAVVFAYFVCMFLSTAAFLAAGHDPMRSLYEVVSAVGTVGLSSGLSGSGLAPGLKVVLCFDMLAGRVEMLALLVLLFPPTWIGRRRLEP
jgi:trk/ktr system potassium uptake protein